jgi:hypothetical protein
MVSVKNLPWTLLQREQKGAHKANLFIQASPMIPRIACFWIFNGERALIR